MYNQPYSNTVFTLSGYFSDDNMDASELSNAYTTARRRTAVQKTIDGEKYYRYELCAAINTGLAKQEIPIPTNVPIQITFNRANSAKSLLQITKSKDGNPITYDEPVVKIISPSLAVYFVESAKADSFYGKAKLYDVSVPFVEYNIRRELLLDSVSNHTIKMFEGPLPSYVVVGIMKPSVFEGDIEYSGFKFERHGLEVADFQVDNTSIAGYPMTLKHGNVIEYYMNYLQTTNRFDNVYANGALSYTNFNESNFLVFINLKGENLTHGQAVLKLKFTNVLPEKMYLIFMPVYEKAIIYDSYFNASVESAK